MSPNHSVIFINSIENEKSSKLSSKQLFFVNPYDILFRILASFVPPIGIKYKKVYVDFLGPILAFLILNAFVYHFYTIKSNVNLSPIDVICVFCVFMPCLCLISCKIGKSYITFSQIVSLIGYSLYGHILTLSMSYLCFHETSNVFFFFCLILFGGLSTLRLTIVILSTIPKPAMRLLICSTISIVNILFLIFLHFAFMHKTYRRY